jgi:hypothetical protein
MTGRRIMLPRPVSASVIGAVEFEVSRALDWDALYPRRGPPGIGDLGIIGPQRTITSGQYASTQGPS